MSAEHRGRTDGGHPHLTREAPLSTLCAALAGTAAVRDAVRAGDLVRTVESTRAPLPERLAAGALLGLAGDPRTPAVPALLPVPGGGTTMGLDPQDVPAVTRTWAHVGVEDHWIRKETPEHPVVLEDFALAAYPVTNHQYLAFLLESGYPHRPGTWPLGAYPWQSANHPVCGVTPQDVEAYLAWLREVSGRRPFRLPTEAEWEHAAKGFEGREFPWGDTFRADAANTRESGVHTTTPVGVYPRGRSPFGHWDMGGNVEEFTADRYAPYPGAEPVMDDLSRTLGSYHVTRGGSFTRHGDLARTRRRHGAYPGPLYPIGFRVACDVVTDATGATGHGGKAAGDER
ncbi:formylglycine-generating enzyme family protein [Streptomyces beigongshangae]|uniref:formylglycine-generating enzyme family protein n=1 Tax=Streptomyces beigongshangae TaxID=2841597 RepID=UPI001C8445FD|nr:SUMF1/EgtB/PvdO family nonheme iron enzyme [Streptomyces sp. REN17]